MVRHRRRCTGRSAARQRVDTLTQPRQGAANRSTAVPAGEIYQQCQNIKIKNSTLSRDESGIRSSDQLQQSYATLRGRKWHEKNGRGVGDNYGRVAANFMEDARSVHSLADDFFLPPGASRGHMQASKTISRSTDKSLDSLGLEEEERLQGLASGNLRSDEILATMLKREPPDGKEKPEPPKHQKLETLSRKNSKCDLLENGGGGGGGGQQQQGPMGNSCGSGPDSASLLSGSSAGTSVIIMSCLRRLYTLTLQGTAWPCSRSRTRPSPRLTRPRQRGTPSRP